MCEVPKGQGGRPEQWMWGEKSCRLAERHLVFAASPGNGCHGWEAWEVVGQNRKCSCCAVRTSSPLTST